MKPSKTQPQTREGIRGARSGVQTVIVSLERLTSTHSKDTLSRRSRRRRGEYGEYTKDDYTKHKERNATTHKQSQQQE